VDGLALGRPLLSWHLLQKSTSKTDLDLFVLSNLFCFFFMELLALGSRPSNDQINYDGPVPAPSLVWREQVKHNLMN